MKQSEYLVEGNTYRLEVLDKDIIELFNSELDSSVLIDAYDYYQALKELDDKEEAIQSCINNKLYKIKHW